MKLTTNHSKLSTINRSPNSTHKGMGWTEHRGSSSYAADTTLMLTTVIRHKGMTPGGKFKLTLWYLINDVSRPCPIILMRHSLNLPPEWKWLHIPYCLLTTSLPKELQNTGQTVFSDLKICIDSFIGVCNKGYCVVFYCN